MKEMFLDPDIYDRYKHEVFRLSLAVQHLGPDGVERGESGLSDAEIARRLGLSEAVVREIRTIAEVDLVPLEFYMNSEDFKDRETRRILQLGRGRQTEA